MGSIIRDRHILIPIFCLWHMAAIAVYLLPVPDGRFEHTVLLARNTTSPYVLLFSQWQKWDIFSPDPQRRASLYRVERNAGDRWETAMRIDYEHLPWWRRAKELKVAGRLEDDWKTLVPHYLLSLCDDIEDGAGSELRLITSTTIIPKYLDQLKRVSKTRATPTETLLGTVRCPRT